MVDLSQVGTLESSGLSAAAFWAALENTFGLNKESVQRGYFQGTLFWFPLRETKSKLADTLYDNVKITDLFRGFRSEASSILLFLNNLERISLCTRGDVDRITETTKVEIEDSKGKIRQSRLEFKQKIQGTTNYCGKDIHNEIQVPIKTTTDGKCQTSIWLVVNYFVGENITPDFQRLIQDRNLGYSPYVGVAAPLLRNMSRFEGHVFCFLPLPREGSRLTGLPVHINGFFALSQNRHHLKLETDEQQEGNIDDKFILWNKCLIKEALPRAYDQLMRTIIATSTSCGNTSDSVQAVYRCLPLSTNTQKRWEVLETELYERMKQVPFLYSTDRNRWISLTESSFATFSSLPFDHAHVQDAVKRCLYQTGREHAEITLGLFNTLRRHASQIQDLSPQLLATHLHQHSEYRHMDSSDKKDVLSYLLSDKSDYEKVDGLELLPLASGGWSMFNKDGETIYCSCEDVLQIIPGLEHRLLMKASELRCPLSDHLTRLCASGKFQSIRPEYIYIALRSSELIKNVIC